MHRRDHAHVHPRAARSAHGQAFPGLEESQQHGLGSGWQLADLVEEHRAAVHAREEPVFLPDGAGEGARSCLKSSLRRRSGVRSAQLMPWNARSRRPLRRWMAEATSSLPVPKSPRINTGRSDEAKSSISRKSAWIAALRPMIPRKEGWSAPAIRAQLRRRAGVSTGGHGNAQPHEGRPVGLGAGRYFSDTASGRGPLPRINRDC